MDIALATLLKWKVALLANVATPSHLAMHGSIFINRHFD
jgi:hypothetical protein